MNKLDFIKNSFTLLLMGISQLSIAQTDPCPPSAYFDYELCYSADNETVQIYIDPVHTTNNIWERWGYGGTYFTFDASTQPLVIPITGPGTHITHYLGWVYDYSDCEDPDVLAHYQAHIDFAPNACDGLSGSIQPTLYPGMAYIEATINDPINGNSSVQGSEFSGVSVNGSANPYSISGTSGIIIQSLNDGDVIDVEYQYTEPGRDGNCCYFTESFVYRDSNTTEIPCEEIIGSTQFSIPSFPSGDLHFTTTVSGAIDLEVSIYDLIEVNNASIVGSTTYYVTQIPTVGDDILFNLSGLVGGDLITVHYTVAGCPMSATFSYGGRGKLSNITEDGFNITYIDNIVSVRNLGQSNATIKISDILGRTVYNSNESIVDVRSLNLNTGIYNVEVVSSNERKTMKIMVQ